MYGQKYAIKFRFEYCWLPAKKYPNYNTNFILIQLIPNGSTEGFVCKDPLFIARTTISHS